MRPTNTPYRAEVAFVCTSLKAGGSERVSIIAAERLARWGIRSHFISHRYEPQEFVISAEVESIITLLPEGDSLYTPNNLAFIQDYLHQHGIAIVFLVYVDVAPFVAMQSALSCRWVYWLHSAPFWELVHAQEEGEVRSRHSIKWWIRWHLLGGKRKAMSEAHRREVYERYRFDLEHVDKYIVLCPEYINEIQDTLSLSESQASKLISLTNTNDPVPEAFTSLSSKEHTIVFAGRFSLVEKRIDLLLKAWHQASSKLPTWSLKLYGTGVDQPLIEQLIARHHIPRVEICGFEPSQRRIYASASISCLTSPIEGWGLALAEAQAWGCVPFAFDCSAGVRAIIGHDGEAGRLIPQGDLESYARELIALCSDHEELQALQGRCLERAKLYMHEVNDDAWGSLLGHLLPSSSSSNSN